MFDRLRLRVDVSKNAVVPTFIDGDEDLLHVEEIFTAEFGSRGPCSPKCFSALCLSSARMCLAHRDIIGPSHNISRTGSCSSRH